MTEAAGGGGRAEMEGRIVQRSLQDEDFRQRLLEDPKGAVEEELEETADTIYLVLPSTLPLGGEELSDQDLEAVAGGGSTFWGATCLAEPACGY